MISQTVLNILESHSQRFGHLSARVENITNNYKQKLWHQLSDDLLEYSTEKCFDEGRDLIELYTQLIQGLNSKINPLKYSLISVNTSRQFQNLEESITFLEEAKGRLAGKQDAIFIIEIAQAEKKLDLGRHHDCLDQLNSVKKSLESLSDVEPKVYATLSKIYAQYYRRKEDNENFYLSSLQFLAFTPPSELTNEQKRDWSIKMGMSVLLGKNIYNITELLDKEILQILRGSDFEWLYELLQSLGTGNIMEFENSINKHHEYITRFPNIMKELTHLKQKVRIISFLELLFAVDKDDRSLSFDRIAIHCRIDKVDVEFLVMKAMSLELIKGLIDEVDAVVHVTWILPRYLSINHLKIMSSKLSDWDNKCENAIRIMENGAQEHLTH